MKPVRRVFAYSGLLPLRLIGPSRRTLDPMKGFGMVTAAVLVVIGIGVGVVGGLPSLQAYRLPPARTYSINGVKFSVAFPGRLGPEPSSLSPCSQGVGAVGDDAHLVVMVQMPGWTDSGRGTCIVIAQLGNNGGGFINERSSQPCSAHLQQPSLLGPLHLRSGLYCSASRVVQKDDAIIIVSATSTEGLQPVESAVNSFKLLGPSS